MWLLCVLSDVLMKMPYVDGELPVYWWDSEADRCMVIGIFRHGIHICVRVWCFTHVCFYQVDVVIMTDKSLRGKTLPRRLLAIVAAGKSKRLWPQQDIYFTDLFVFYYFVVY